MALRKKRPYEQELEGSTVKKKCLSLVSDHVMKDPRMQNINLKLKLDHQNKWKVKKPDRRHHSDQSRQKSAPASTTDMTNTHHQQQDTMVNRVCLSPPEESSKVPVVRLFRLNIQTENQEEESINECDTEQHHEQQPAPDEDTFHSKSLPSNLAQNEFSASTHHHQQGTATRVCVSPPEEITKVPVVRLFRLNIQTDTEKDESTNERDTEQHHEQEPAPDDDSVHSKSSSSSLAHNEPLASTTEKTNTHHQQKGTTASRVCVSPPEESSKVPVVRLFRLNIQTKEEESTKECDAEQHHEQEHRKTDKQERARRNKTCTSEEKISRGKQPVVKLCRLEKQLEEKELSKLDSEHDSAHELASPSKNKARDGTDLPSPPQNAILPPNTDDTRKHDQREETINAGSSTDESDNEHHYDHVQSEDQEEQSSDDSDSDQSEQDLEMFSSYEIERLKNIKQNAKFLKSLQLLEIVSSFGQKRKTKPWVKREKPQSDMEKRRSKRIQRKVLIEMKDKSKPVTDVISGAWRKPDIPTGPIKMFPTNLSRWSKVDHRAWESFQDMCKNISKDEFPRPLTFNCPNLSSYKCRLKSLKLGRRAVSRIHPAAVSSTAVHPSTAQTLVAAGDLCGNVRLWDLKQKSAYLFPLHAGKTSVAFSPSDPRHLVTLGREGTIRFGDISRSVFDEVYRKEEYLTSFDFLSASGSVLIVSHFNSKLSVVDCRTPTNSSDVQGNLGMKYTRTVSVHPLNRDLCVVAGLSKIHIFDVRMLNTTWTKQTVVSLTDYPNKVLSASFSPVTGKHILTCFLDGNVRVFRMEDFEKRPSKILTFYGHLSNDTYFLPATWDPKQEDCFAHGCMGIAQIHFCNIKSQVMHVLSSSYLSSRPSAIAIHPTSNLVVAGTLNGKLCVWKE